MLKVVSATQQACTTTPSKRSPGCIVDTGLAKGSEAPPKDAPVPLHSRTRPSAPKKRGWYVDRSNCTRRLNYVGRPGSRRWRRHESLRAIQDGCELEECDMQVMYEYLPDSPFSQATATDAHTQVFSV